jgi:hypothetical protein
MITPRNSVCHLWNEKALRKLQAATGNTLYHANAEDMVSTERQQLMIGQQLKCVTLKTEWTGHLPEQVDLVVGMWCMVTLNVATDLDLVNGSTGVVIDIVLDPWEKPT